MGTEAALESEGLSVWEETGALIIKGGLGGNVSRTKAKVKNETVEDRSG